MSLWLDSLGSWGRGIVNLDAPREQQEAEARHILTHLAMIVPKTWWENALSRGIEPDPSHVFILKRSKKQLEKLPELAGVVSYSALVALPFAYCPDSLEGERMRDLLQNLPLEALIAQTSSILESRPELQKLGERVAQLAEKIG
jgi:hypothetical protein